MKTLCRFLVGIVVLATVACSQTRSKPDELTYSEYQQKGNEITKIAQITLLQNVGKAMQKGGTEYAIEFCNLHSVTIIDSLNTAANCTISRISEKNRNPENKLSTKLDSELWEIFKTGTVADTVIMEKQSLVYYKPIRTAMPACLQCHGTPGSDIDSLTFAKIRKLYPDDLATGYKIDDFRGLWKVRFNL